MAEFCNQCARDLGLPEGDFAGIGPPLHRGYMYPALCEGCGMIGVDHLGNCIMCQRKAGRPGHGPAPPSPEKKRLEEMLNSQPQPQKPRITESSFVPDDKQKLTDMLNPEQEAENEEGNGDGEDGAEYHGGGGKSPQS